MRKKKKEGEREIERKGGRVAVAGDNYLFVASRSRHTLVTVLRHGMHYVPILGSRKTSRDNPGSHERESHYGVAPRMAGY